MGTVRDVLSTARSKQPITHKPQSNSLFTQKNEEVELEILRKKYQELALAKLSKEKINENLNIEVYRLNDFESKPTV